MSYADDVREYCRREIVTPARERGEIVVSIRAGDVHRALRYKNRLPLVCSALGSQLFEELSKVKRVSLEGPINGSNAVFTYRLNPGD